MICKVKRCKLLIYALIAALILPMGVSSHEVYAAVADSEDEITPSVIVYNYKDLVQAIDNAEDGDVIGIASNIEVDSGIQMLGSDDKQITIIKAFEGAFIRMYLDVDIKVKNIVFDGNSSVYNRDYNPMIQVEGKAEFENVTFRNCYNQWSGGALQVEGAKVTLTDCYFKNNQASSGAHIMVHSSSYVQATNCMFENGLSENGGGAVKLEKLYGSGEPNKIEFFNCTIIGNKARYGGAIENFGDVKISNSIIYGNTAEAAADILNYTGSSFEMDMLDNLTELYATVGVIPLEWEIDYTDNAYIGGNIDKENPLSAIKLKYEIIQKENDSDANSPEDNPSDSDKPQTENNDTENESDKGNNDSNSEKDSLIDTDNSEDKEDAPSDVSGDSDTENEDSQNKDTTEDDSNTSNNSSDDEQNTESNNEQSNTDITENEGGKNENNSTDSNVTTGGNDNQDVDSSLDESTENNSSDTPNTEETTETNAPNDSENNDKNESDKNESDNQEDSNMQLESDNSDSNNVNSSGNNVTSDSGSNGAQNNNSPGNDTNIALDNHKPADNDNSNSTNTNNGSVNNTDNGTSQNGGNAISKPENSDNSSSDSSNKDTVSNSGSISHITNHISGDNENENKPSNISNDSEQKNTIIKKKAIKKLSLTAKKGKRKITGKTVKKAAIKIRIDKKTYKVKSNSKGKFTIKLKGKAKLKKGQKIVVTVKKNGYKTKKKVFKVK